MIISKTLKDFNYKLFLTLILTLLLPTLYTTLRIYFLGNLPSDFGINIASQLSWVNLIFESIQEAIILPLFFLIGNSLRDKAGLENKIKTGLLMVLRQVLGQYFFRLLRTFFIRYL